MRKKKKTDGERLYEAASAALDTAMTAITQLALTEVETKRSVRSETTDPKLGKIVTTEEEKSVELVEGGIDVGSLKQITATLKDIKEILNVSGDADGETGVILLPAVPEGEGKS